MTTEQRDKDTKEKRRRRLRNSILTFVVCCVCAFFTAYVLFPPRKVLTPMAFVLAAAVYVGIYCGVGAFVLEIAASASAAKTRQAEWEDIATNHKRGDNKKKAEETYDLFNEFNKGMIEGSISHWKDTRSFVVYVFLMVAIPILALLILTGPVGAFIKLDMRLHPQQTSLQSQRPVDSARDREQRIGKVIKDALSSASVDVQVRQDLERLDERLSGKELSLLIETDDIADPEYGDAVHWLTLIALTVVGLYLVADIFGLWKTGEKSFLIMVVVDAFVLAFHLSAETLMTHSKSHPFDWTFSPTMIVSFSGGMMGVTLIVQCLVYAFLPYLEAEFENEEVENLTTQDIIKDLSEALSLLQKSANDVGGEHAVE